MNEHELFFVRYKESVESYGMNGTEVIVASYAIHEFIG